jgi:hypothetical protein
MVPFGRKNSSIIVLRSNDSLEEKSDYIFQNPVRAGLVKNASEYRWMWRAEMPII